MALTDNPYIGLPLVEIQQLQQLALQALANVLKTGRSYAFPGLSMTRADLPELRQMLSDLRIAISYTTGSVKQSAQAIIDTQSQFSAYGC